MAFVAIPNNNQYEYDNAPPDPGVGHPTRALWLKSSNGVRTEHGRTVYVRCRRIGSGNVDHGELSKSYWDARGTEDNFAAAAEDVFAVYVVNSFEPDLVFDFKNSVYKTGGNSSTLMDSITHSSGSLATMVHTDDVDLIGGLNQFTSAAPSNNTNTDDIQSIGDVNISLLANGNLQLLSTGTGTYGVVMKVAVEPLTEYTLSYGVSNKPLNEYIKIGSQGKTSQDIRLYYDTITGDNRLQFKPNINRTQIWITITASYTANNQPKDRSFEFTHITLKKVPTVKWAPHNLLPLSNTFDSGWGKRPGTSIVANNAVAPNGIANTASTVSFSSTTSQLYKLTTVSFSVGDKVTLAAWVRSDNITSLTLSINGHTNSANNTPFVNKAVTSTWTLIEFETTIPANDSGLYFIFGWNAVHTVNTQIGDIEIYGAHMYRSDMDMVNNTDTNDSYVPTTNYPVYQPRVGHYSYDKFLGWSNGGLLHESEARTNVVFPSADFSNSNWIKHNNITVTTGSYNGSKNPDGVDYAQYVNDYNQVGYLELNTPNNLTPDHVRSIWAKSQYGGTVGLLTDYRNAGSEVTLTTEWQRFEIKVPSTDHNSVSFIAVDFRIGNLTRVWIWGAQAELGDYASSYIPTSGSQVTRAADVLTVPAANLPYSSTNMSIQMDGKMDYADNNIFREVNFTRWLKDGLNFIQNSLHTNGNNEGLLYYSQRGASDLEKSVSSYANPAYFTPDINIPFNIASRHGSSFLNGAEGGTALTANTTPTSLPDLSSRDLELGLQFMGTIGKFRMWDEDLGDTGIEEASTPPPSDAFLMTVRVNAGETMVVPTDSNGNYNAEVDWGDGTVDLITDHNSYQNLHTYADAGDYQVSIRGLFPKINFYNDYIHSQQHANRVISIDNLGKTGLMDMRYAFYKLINMVSFTTGGDTNANPENLANAFERCYKMETCDLTGIRTTAASDFSGSFWSCYKLTSLDLSGFDFSNARYMNRMFKDCLDLETINLSGADTSNVIRMQELFQGCRALTSVDLSSFDTSNVTSFSKMFYDCRALTEVDISSFDTSSANTLDYMFYRCYELTSLDLSNWDTSSITNMDSVFYNCREITSINVSNWDTSSVTDFEYMFSTCYKLVSLDLSSFSGTGTAASIRNMFAHSRILVTVDLSNFDTSNVARMDWMFYNTPLLTEVTGIENWNIQGLTTSAGLNYLFWGTVLDTVVYDQLLVNWEAQASSISAQNVNFGYSEFTQNSAAHTARSSLITTYGWTISDGGYA